MVYEYPGGIADFVRYLNASKEPVHAQVIEFGDEQPGMSAEIAMQWNGSYNESVHTFANVINTAEGGTHEEGFRAALTTVVNKYARDTKFLKEKDQNLTGEDIREGLTAIVSIKLAEPQFEGQTKTKLGNTEAKSFVQKVTNDQLRDWFDRNPGEAKGIIDKVQQAARARIAARRRATSPGASRRWRPTGCRASWPTASRPTRPSPRSTWSRATRPAARPRAAGTRSSRRSCRSAARSSTSRSPASTGCSRTPRSSR